jgi:hypothetical protein
VAMTGSSVSVKTSSRFCESVSAETFTDMSSKCSKIKTNPLDTKILSYNLEPNSRHNLLVLKSHEIHYLFYPRTGDKNRDAFCLITLPLIHSDSSKIQYL